MFQLAMKMIKKNSKAAFLYFFIMTWTVAISFVFTASANSRVLNENVAFNGFKTSEEWIYAANAKSWSEIAHAFPTSDYLNSIIVLFCCFLIFYVNNNYIYHKKNEIAILKVSGASEIQIIYYFLLQTALLFLVACIPGMLIGYAGIYILFHTVAYVMHTTPASLTTMSLIQTAVLIAVIFLYIGLYVMSYIFHIRVKDLLATHAAVRIRNEPTPRKYSNKRFVFFLLAGIFFILYKKVPYDNQSYQLGLIFIGLYGVVNGVISDVVQWWKKKNFYKHPLFSVAISNYNTALLSSRVTIIVTLFSVIMMFFVTLLFHADMNEFILSLIGYGISIILLSFTITFDLIVQANHRITYYLNLWKIGYTREQLKKIVRQELILFYSTILILSLIIMLPLAYRFLIARAFNPTLCLSMILFYVGFFSITGILSYRLYIKTLLKEIVLER